MLRLDRSNLPALHEAMKRITSRQNPLVARFRAAARGELPALLLDGAHLVDEALNAGTVIRAAVVRSDAIEDEAIEGLLRRLERADVELTAAPPAVMDAISPVRSSSPIVALADRPAADDDRVFGDSSPLVVLACDIQDPGNLGAIVRVAEAAGATGMVAAGQSADPFGWKALRGSMGSVLRLPIVRRPSIQHVIDAARERGCRIVATVPRNGRSLFDVDLRGPLAIAIGGEGPGLPAEAIEAADVEVSVPMQPPVESLNAAVTAALLLYEARRQRT
jgi:TrmH family RNA methyltransferase